MLAGLLGESALPESRRNRIRTAELGSHRTVVARTGYTGERACFELFVPREGALELWSRLVEKGALPAGLGARDSLRLEAGLPLYGHELGLDLDGEDIPIFANALARFGVRAPGKGTYVGMQALDLQRAEFDAIARGECATAPPNRILKRLVKPIAAFASRRPLRAGYRLLLDGAAVGHVTSGTSVPIVDAAAPPETPLPIRPIGLALVRSDIRFDARRPVHFAVHDARGEIMTATLVERNLPPAPAPRQ
jgi:aminomethyltransferase